MMMKSICRFITKKVVPLVVVSTFLAIGGCGKEYEGEKEEYEETEEPGGDKVEASLLEKENEEQNQTIVEHDASELHEAFSEKYSPEDFIQDKVEVDPTVISDVKPGDVVEFGTYVQSSRGAEPDPIEWVVLDVDGGNALLLSIYCLDCLPYNEKGGETSWEKCSLREWLNGEFYDSAFSNGDKKIIPLTHLKNERNGETGASGGNDADVR